MHANGAQSYRPLPRRAAAKRRLRREVKESHAISRDLFARGPDASQGHASVYCAVSCASFLSVGACAAPSPVSDAPFSARKSATHDVMPVIYLDFALYIEAPREAHLCIAYDTQL